MTEPASAQTMMACSQCGRTFARSDLVQIAGKPVCAQCKPGFLSKVVAGDQGATSPEGWRYGGVWVRFGARIIDSLVLMVPLIILLAVLIPGLLRARPAAPSIAISGALLSFIVVIFLAVIAYEVVMLRQWGATVGKMACGLKVVRSDGRSLGWGVSFGRFFMWNVVTNGIPYVNFILMLISTIMAGTDGEKRAIHDRVCDTRVIYKESLAAA